MPDEFDAFPLGSLEVSGYVPELLLAEQKSDAPSRVCRETCAILDTYNPSRILAYRGAESLEGRSFEARFGISDTDMQFLRRNLRSGEALLLGGRPTPVVVFCDFAEPGILIALSPELPTHDFLRALLLQGEYLPIRSAPSQGLWPTLPATPSREALALIREWCFYRDRIAGRVRSLDLRMRCLAIANFVGFRADAGLLPVGLSLAPEQSDRFAAFFLCLLLSCRHEADAQIRALTSEETALSCRFTLTRITAKKQSRRPQALSFDFLSLPTLSELSLREDDTGFVIDLPLFPTHAPIPLLHATDFEPSLLSMALSFAFLSKKA